MKSKYQTLAVNYFSICVFPGKVTVFFKKSMRVELKIKMTPAAQGTTPFGVRTERNEVESKDLRTNFIWQITRVRRSFDLFHSLRITRKRSCAGTPQFCTLHFALNQVSAETSNNLFNILQTGRTRESAVCAHKYRTCVQLLLYVWSHDSEFAFPLRFPL